MTISISDEITALQECIDSVTGMHESEEMMDSEDAALVAALCRTLERLRRPSVVMYGLYFSHGFICSVHASVEEAIEAQRKRSMLPDHCPIRRVTITAEGEG